MIPEQTLLNFPLFGDNATKVEPDNNKKSNGWQQGDVVPAEWMNWEWYHASKGVADLNKGVSSMEKEINAVLSNFNIAPDESDNDQLLEALTKLKREAALAAHPVGSLYWTSSSENPGVTFGGGTWVQIKDKFILAAGDTYSNGGTGGAATVTLTTNEMPSHAHTQQGTFTTVTDGYHGHPLQVATADGSRGDGGANAVVGSNTASYGPYVLSGPNNQATTSGGHSHTLTISGDTTSTGSGQAHENMPPYIVKYCWERTA